MRIASLFQSRRQQPNQAKRPAPRTWRPRVEWLEERLPLAINVEFDFSCDASGFFNEPARREVLQEAANEIVGRLNDTLAELPANSGGFTWTAVFDNPGPGNLACGGNVVKKSFSLPANTLKIFVAGRTFDTPGPSLARPKLGITETQGDAAWDARVKGRLEPGATASPATDFGPWGGSISFDVTASSKSWFIGLLEKSPIRPLLPDEYDFFSVAQRAIGSLLGFGTTDSWNRFLTDSAFTGSKATEIYGAPVPVTKVATGTFWKDGTLFDGKPVSMDLVFNAGQRVHFTNLDLAALHDLGWEVTYAPNAPAPSQDNSRIVVTGIDGLKKFNPPNDFTERHIHEASFNGLIYRAGIDDDDGLWVDVSGDGGQTFRDRNDFGGGEEAIFTPSLTVHGDRLFMAWPGTDSDHLVNVAVIETDADGSPTRLVEKTVTGYSTSTEGTFPFGVIEQTAVDLISFRGALFLSWLGEHPEDRIYLDFLSEAKPQWGPSAFDTGLDSRLWAPLTVFNDKLRISLDDGQVGTIQLVTETRQKLETFPLQNGVLTIHGDLNIANFDDTVLIERDDQGPNPSGVKVTVNGAVARFSEKKVSRIIVNTRGGNDTVTVKPDLIPLTVDAWLGSGDDTLTAERALGGLYVNGEDGDDTINLETLRRDATARLDGGPGDDKINLAPRLKSLNEFQGRVTVDGTWVGQDRLTLNDRDGAGLGGFSLYGDGIRLPNLDGLVEYHRIGELVVSAAAAGNPWVSVLGNANGVSTAIVDAANVDLGAPGPFCDVGGSCAKRMDGIRGSVSIENSTRRTALTLDDSGTTATPRNARISNLQVEGLTENPVGYLFGYLDSLTVHSGSAGNSITVNADFLFPGDPADKLGPITLNTGLGADSVHVLSTRTELTVNGQSGFDAVDVGWDGDMQFIRRPLFVGNAGSFTAVTLDDSADTDGRSVILSEVGPWTRVGGLAPANIFLAQADLRFLKVQGGRGNDSLTIGDTPTSGFGVRTVVEAGDGDDVISIDGTTDPLLVTAGGGSNLIKVGSSASGLNGINGEVTASGLGGNTRLFVSDSANPTGFTPSYFSYEYIVDADLVQRTDRAAISYQNMFNLTLFTSQTTDQVTIRGTAPFADSSGGTVIATADGDDSVSVRGSDGYLRVDLGRGYGSVTLGDATTSLDAIRGQVDVSNGSGGFLDVHISNAASTTPQNATFRRSTLFGFAAERVERFEYREGDAVPLNTFNFLTQGSGQIGYSTGRGGDVVFVSGTQANLATNLFGQPGALETFAFGFAADLNDILGSAAVVGQAADNDFAYYYDYFNPSPQTYQAFTSPFVTEALVMQRSGIASVGLVGLRQVIFYAPLVGGSTVNIQGVPSSTILNMGAGDGDVVTLGRNAPHLGGSLADVRGPVLVTAYATSGGVDAPIVAAVSLILDNSGNAAATLRQATLGVATSPGIDDYDFINGLGPAGIYWDLGPHSSVQILGGAADETFSLASSAFITPIFIDGAGGTNTLDYSAVADGVHVNLQLGTASGLAGGIHSIQNVTGSSGNDILVGSGGNVLRGGLGRDLLIAGPLASQLFGDDDEDLLIGGTVNDSSTENFDAILANWAAIGENNDYTSRVARLRAGLLADGKITGNGGINTLTGNGGLDLFFGSLVSDGQIVDGEQVFP